MHKGEDMKTIPDNFINFLEVYFWYYIKPFMVNFNVLLLSTTVNSYGNLCYKI